MGACVNRPYDTSQPRELYGESSINLGMGVTDRWWNLYLWENIYPKTLKMLFGFIQRQRQHWISLRIKGSNFKQIFGYSKLLSNLKEKVRVIDEVSEFTEKEISNQIKIRLETKVSNIKYYNLYN